jgi:hypothetical protein
VLAARLAALFRTDMEIVARLNDAQRRLRDANERLWSGLAPDAFGRVDGAVAAAGASQMARLMGDALSGGGRGSVVVVLGALEEIHCQVHQWFASESMTQIWVLISPHLRGFRLHQEGVLDDRVGTFSGQ